MNFFSHYLVDHRPQSPCYNVALIMPDLLRNFTPEHCKYNFHHFLSLVSESSKDGSTLKPFFEGCLQHIARDKAFHASHFFTNNYQFLRDDWKELCNRFEIPKYWFSLHVIIEIMLDKYFIDNYIEKLHNFYFELIQERNTVANALEFLHHPQPAKFLERYDRFCEIQYLFHYQNIDRIAFALHKIYQQVKLPTAWYENHEKEICDAIEGMYQRWESEIILLGLHEIQG